jgi:hypothetical protein
MRSFGAMVNSYVHSRCKFVPNVVDTVPHVGCTGGFIGSKFVWYILYVTSSVRGLNETLVSKRMKYISTVTLILQYSCVTLAESLYIVNHLENCLGFVHIQVHSHSTPEFGSVGPLQLGYAVFIASQFVSELKWFFFFLQFFVYVE